VRHNQVTKATEHICVCICTYQRPQSLKRLLEKLEGQETNGLFSYSVVVVDNDHSQSSEEIVSDFSAASSTSIKYCVEPRQNIALARNKTIENSSGEFIAFIDDDEFPTNRWLLTLFEAVNEYGVDGVLGPVLPHFEPAPPQWVIKSKCYDRPRHRTGYKLGAKDTRTGNVLFRKSILDGVDPSFRPELGTGGEDVDFFRRMIGKGCKFVWCNEAPVFEEIPQSRCTRGYLLKRALLRGSNFPKHSKHRVRDTLTSLIAVPCYTLALPVLGLFGQHLIVRYLVKLCDHSARILAMCGWKLMTRREM
jgi:succinoglycan biosynthesis protein ExoM